ncbi:preprotein translocase subunit SecE [Luteibaculum oceani]|uniref:Protein translocase subunit SecE n=1 Tax=Luteibaculum oceani TaxID=1294296 RepID=A0A5C6VB57_9FLAO|nr:preprotein translocase subunit SecE [Luteibaculum oceani]TXC81626.1 preprotein translocase subunit SecE [Luteibaculum oceani]
MANIKAYIEDVYNEMVHKVTWPTWKELQSSSILVLVASAIIALLIFLMDYIFGINGEDSLWRGILGYVYQILGDL